MGSHPAICKLKCELKHEIKYLKRTSSFCIYIYMEKEKNMRLRNIPGAKEAVMESAFVVQRPQEWRLFLLWQSLFCVKKQG